jgi:hypothetical protein
MDELLAALKSLKNKNMPETDGPNKELPKCASQKLTDAFSRSEYYLLVVWTSAKRMKDYLNCCDVYDNGARTVKTQRYVC